MYGIKRRLNQNICINSAFKTVKRCKTKNLQVKAYL